MIVALVVDDGECVAHMCLVVTRSCDELAHDENRIDALQDVSKAARNARRKITESLQLMNTAEDDLRSKLGSLRDSMSKSKFLVRVEVT